MHLDAIMSKHVMTVGGETTVAEAARRMEAANVGCLIVTGGSTSGVITDRDLVVRCLAQGHDYRHCSVSQHMSSPMIAARPDTEIIQAAHLMAERHVRRLPIMADGRLVGLVSLSDIAEAMERPVHDLLQAVGAARRTG